MRHRPPRCDPPSHHRFSCADDAEPSHQSPLSGSAYALILTAQRRGKEVRRRGKKDPESALPSGCLSAVKRGTSLARKGPVTAHRESLQRGTCLPPCRCFVLHPSRLRVAPPRCFRPRPWGEVADSRALRRVDEKPPRA